jgi:ribosomal protein S18 acetylase RimI-like enzyme
MGSMLTRPMNKGDFDEIVRVIDRWWGGPTASLAHPVFFYELGQVARIVEHEGGMIGFLLGFITGDESPVGYIHMIGIHPDHRRRHVGRKLYESFEDSCRSAGCTRLKAMTAPGDTRSVDFHVALGWRWETVRDYAGPGRDRVVFTKQIG